jgi:hypothetical protein
MMTTHAERRERMPEDREAHASEAAAQNLRVAAGIAGLMALSVLVAILLVR